MMRTVARRLRPAASACLEQNHVMTPAGRWREASAMAPFAVGGSRASSGMPQLDVFTYMSQYTWMCAGFFGLYLALYNNGLPLIARILKARKHLANEASQAVSVEQTPPSDLQSVLIEVEKSSVEYLNNSVAGASKWCDEVVKSMNASQLKGLNQSYVASLGEMTLVEGLKKNSLDILAPVALQTKGLEQLAIPSLNKAFIVRAQRSVLGTSKIGKRTRK